MIDMYMDQRGKIVGRGIKYLGKYVEIIFRVLRRKSSRNTEGKARLFGMSTWILTPKCNNGERMAVCNQKWCEPDSSNNLFLQVAIKHNQSRTGLKENSGPSGVPLGNFPSADTIHWVYLYSSLFISHDSHEAVHWLYKVQKESNSIEWSKEKISCGKGWSRKSALPFCFKYT